MKLINKSTGKDVSSLYLKLMEGKITRETFERLSGIEKINYFDTPDVHRKDSWMGRIFRGVENSIVKK